MKDLLTALGLVMVLEGALYALFPKQMKDFMRAVCDMQDTSIRNAGLVAAVLGVIVLGVLRGY